MQYGPQSPLKELVIINIGLMIKIDLTRHRNLMGPNIN